LRNDLEIFSFAPESTSFGSKGAIIKNVRLTDTSGNQLAWAVGGEEVSIEIEIYAQQFISGAIVGFYINDRLGQALFGDNTYLNYLDDPFCAPEGTRFVATFQFSMPVLPRGKYTLTVAIAEGTQNDHIQHHWIHDALMIESHSSSASTGLVGIPMHKITINSLD
jgi:lipopolysaccharide transport system ATP-binding protein